MKLVDTILKEAQLNELNIQKKGELGRGKEHTVYDMKTMPGHIVKKKHYDNEDEDFPVLNGINDMVQAYEQAPYLVAKVARKGEDWAIVEKLDNARVQREMDLFSKIIYGGDREDILYRMYPDMNQKYLSLFRSKVKETGDQDLMDKLEQYVTFASDVIENFPEDDGHYIDFQRGNIGYDAEGNLKLLDV